MSAAEELTPAEPPPSPLSVAARGPRPRVGHKNRGCAVSCGVLMILGIAATIIGAYGMFFSFNRTIAMYFSEDRKVFAPVTLSPEAIADARTRAQAFIAALEKQEAPPALLLSADEVNALLADFAKDNKFELPAQVSFADDKIHAELSIPLRGLYINGSGDLDIGLSNGVLQVYVNHLEINGKAPPGPLAELAKQHNLASAVMDDPDVKRVVSQLQYVTITGGKLKITPKPTGEKQGE